MDDFELDSLQYLSHYLKLWGDPYGQLDGEIKGSTIPLNYTQLWITSNYSIYDCVKKVQMSKPNLDYDYALEAAIKRRFIQLRMNEDGTWTEI